MSSLTLGLPRLDLRNFVFVRHGETDANQNGIIAGVIEAELSQKGKDQARALYPRLKHWNPDHVYVSPQGRAVETARLALRYGVEKYDAGFDEERDHFHLCDGLRERNWGVFEGKSQSQLPDRFGTPEGGEGFEEVYIRVITAINDIPKTVELPLLICHSGVYRALLWATGGDVQGPSVRNATPVKFSHDPERLGQGKWLVEQEF